MDPPDVALSQCRIDVRVVDGRPVEMVRAAPKVRSFPSRVSEGLGICLKVGDAHDVLVNGRRVTYPGGSLSLRAPGCVWASETGHHGFLSIDVDPALLPVESKSKTMDFVLPTLLPDVAGTVRRLLDPHDELSAEVALTELIASALRLSSSFDESLPGAASAKSVADAREFLAANLAGRPTLTATAAAVGSSKFALVRRFREETGTTPHAYLTMLRANRAKALLTTGASPVEAALAAGFADQSHLGLWFRRIFGTTPAAYRREAVAGSAIS